MAWLWKFVDGARSAGELYGRVMVVFAAQHYALQLVLARSQRRSSALPASRRDAARKAFERVTKRVLPASHKQLVQALEREARTYARRQAELAAAAVTETAAHGDMPSDDELEDLDEAESALG